MLLELENVSVRYDNVIIGLRDVSLKVPKGAVVTLLGPNGAGKSTTLKAISGILGVEGGRVASGVIRLDGQRIDGKSATEMVRMGVCHVMEGREVFRGLTVEENLQVGLMHRRGGSARGRDAFDVAYHYFPVLKSRRRQAAGYLSGGEQQMLAIARALMVNPTVMLLDEPSLGLAPIMAKQVYEIVVRINAEQGTTVLLVEQNVALALSVSQYAYILTNGQIALEGAAADVAKQDIRGAYLGLHPA